MNEDGKVIIKVDADTSSFDKKIDEIKSKEYDRLDLSDDLTDNLEEQTAELGKQGKTTTVLQRVVTKLASKFTGIAQSTLTMARNILQFALGFGSVIGIVGIIALAIGGIVGALADIISKDEELNKDWEDLKVTVQYLWFSLKQAFTGIAEALLKAAKWLLDVFKKIIVAIGAVIYLLTGFNIFDDSGIDRFKKSLDGSNKSAKELKKTLAGFDEMTILNDNGTTSGISPVMDLSGLANLSEEVLQFADKLIAKKDIIFKIAAVLAGLFVASRIKGWMKNIGLLFGAKGLGGVLTLLGKIVLIGAGIIITITIAKKIWEEAEQLKKEIKEIREAGAEAQKEWIKNEENINNLIDTGNVNRTAGYELLKKSGGVWNWINGLGKENLETAKQVSENVDLQIKKEVELYKQKKLTDEEAQKVKQSIIDQYQYNLKVIEALRREGEDTKGIEALNQNLIQNYKDMGGNVEEVRDKLGEINEIKFDNKTVDVTIKADTSSFETNFQKAIKRAREYAKQMLGGLGFASGGGGAGSWGGGSGGGIRGAKGLMYLPKFTPLAKGGIVNNPGRGIFYRGANIGEQRPEAVVPLTDAQQMELLGETIGKYINLNATIPVYVGNRQVAREIKRINLENEFAGNR